MSFANNCPIVRASYSAWFFDALKPKHMDCFIQKFLRPSSTILTPYPFLFGDPSTNSVYTPFVLGSSSSSDVKSAKHWDFMGPLALYLTLNSYNSTDHAIIHPTMKNQLIRKLFNQLEIYF